MDISIIIGVFLAWSCVMACLILEGNKLSAFLSLSSFLLVIGGSIGSTIIGFRIKDIGSIIKVVISTIKPLQIDLKGLIIQLKNLALQARRGGILSLEESISSLNNDYIKTGLQLVVDGLDSETIQKILDTKAAIIQEKSRMAAKFFESLGGYAPTLGIIGTVLGLVKVLGHLSEPEKLGEGIAEAFVATLYGISSANLIFLPIAAKIKANIERESLYFSMMQEGILSIHAGDNPILLEEKLKAYLVGQEKEDARKDKGLNKSNETVLKEEVYA